MSYTLDAKCPNCGETFQETRAELSPDTKFTCPRCGLGFQLAPEDYAVLAKSIEDLKEKLAGLWRKR